MSIHSGSHGPGAIHTELTKILTAENGAKRHHLLAGDAIRIGAATIARTRPHKSNLECAAEVTHKYSQKHRHTYMRCQMTHRGGGEVVGGAAQRGLGEEGRRRLEADLQEWARI